jgi:hypothetical protein
LMWIMPQRPGERIDKSIRTDRQWLQEFSEGLVMPYETLHFLGQNPGVFLNYNRKVPFGEITP